MSYSVCLKCKSRVGWYDKYCSLCQKKYGLLNLPDWQKDNFTHENFDAWAKSEVEKDMKTKEDIPVKQVERGITLFFKAARLKVIYRLISLTPARELKRIQLQRVIKDMKALKGGDR